MASARIQLRVVKTDGSIERYLHTKVVGTINNAFAAAGCGDAVVADQLAQAVTYYLYHNKKAGTINSSDIFSIILAVLSGTGYDNTGIALKEYQFQRQLKRLRVEVADVDLAGLDDAERMAGVALAANRSRWDKSRIVSGLVSRYRVPHHVARTIASMVEEKIFAIGVSVVPASLVKQLVLSDAAAILSAHQQLQTA